MPDCIKGMFSHFGGDINLPAQFTDIGNPVRPSIDMTYCYLFRLSKAEGVIFKRLVNHWLQHRACLWSHNSNHRF